MKKIFLLSLLLYPSSIFTHYAKNEPSENTSHYHNEHDAHIFDFCKGLFQGAGIISNHSRTPSQILMSFSEDVTSDLDETTRRFILDTLRPHYREIDTTFRAKLEETHDIGTTWNWLAEHYFGENNVLTD